jgi:hypothetical protein
MTFSTYATYVRGLDVEGPIPGLLTVDAEVLRFETFDRKAGLEMLLPEAWRPQRKAIELVIPCEEIARITDLDGRKQTKKTWLARVMRWMNLEPNGIRVEWGEKVIVFDCERGIDALLF